MQHPRKTFPALAVALVLSVASIAPALASIQPGYYSQHGSLDGAGTYDDPARTERSLCRSYIASRDAHTRGLHDRYIYLQVGPPGDVSRTYYVGTCAGRFGE